MQLFLSIFNRQTVIILLVALVSSVGSLLLRFSIYIDFLILSLIIVFPLTITIKEAFNRREKAIRSYSNLKASLSTLFYLFENENVDWDKKNAFKNELIKLSASLKKYLNGEYGHAAIVQKDAESIARYFIINCEFIKKPFAMKSILFTQRIQADIEFLLATKRHHTPTGIRAIILFTIYVFVLFYPASLLHDTGFDVSALYIFAMTGFKSLVLISIYNAQVQLEDPFNGNSPDSIRLDDFQFRGWIEAPNK
jgi:ABC-type multidrug transport system fused ATPase/permease subunit